MDKEKAFVLLGGNIGDRTQRLLEARTGIEAKFEIVNASHVYETEAWGLQDQPAFLNQVLEVVTDLPPLPFLQELLSIELSIGRTRNIKWEPRVIDIDLLFYGAHVSDHEELRLPHPLIGKRNFVLVPLLEIAPHLIHPIENKTIEELYLACSDRLDVVVLDDGV